MSSKYHFIEYEKGKKVKRTHDSRCPDCEIELCCPCDSCGERNRGKLKDIWKNNDKGILQIECPNCGFTASMEFWTDLEVKKAKKEGSWPKD